MSLRDPDQLPAQTVVSAVESAIGLAQARASEAEEREKGIVGLIAAFLRWPTTVREAVGPDHAAQRRAASALGVVAQLVVGISASTFAAGVVATADSPAVARDRLSAGIWKAEQALMSAFVVMTDESAHPRL